MASGFPVSLHRAWLAAPAVEHDFQCGRHLETASNHFIEKSRIGAGL